MKDQLSAAAVFELSMFGIMVLFLSFCGFFTFKHCYYTWRRKRRKRCKHSLESVLNLFYNEDYYYLESGTPYLPPPVCESPAVVQKDRGVGEDEDTEASFASEPSQGQSVRWNGTEKISLDKYKLCPQIMQSEIRDTSSQRKLQRQTKFLGSVENITGSYETPRIDPVRSADGPPLPTSDQFSSSRPHSLTVSRSKSSSTERSPTEQRLSPTEQRLSPTGTRAASFSIRKIVATSKFIGAAHRAKKKLRMQSRFHPETFRYRDDSGENSGSFEKRSPTNCDGDDLRQNASKGRVNSLDVSGIKPRQQSSLELSRGDQLKVFRSDARTQADLTRGSPTREDHVDTFTATRDSPTTSSRNQKVNVDNCTPAPAWDERSSKLKDTPSRWVKLRAGVARASPARQYSYSESMQEADEGNRKSRRAKRFKKLMSYDGASPSIRRADRNVDHVSGRRRDDRPRTSDDVEELYEKYERMEKSSYAEMLRKAKMLKREDLPFLDRKHLSY